MSNLNTDQHNQDQHSIPENETSLPSMKGDESLQEKKEHALVVHFKELDKKAETWIQSWNPYHPAVIGNRGLQPVLVEESQLRKRASQIIIGAFLLFLIWAIFAPIDAGVTAQGVVKVSGYRKTLQHPTGGIIEDILVKEGQEVNEGDPLIRINPLKVNADYTAANLQYINALVTEARLKSELEGANKIVWPAEIESREQDSQVAEAMAIQAKLFETRRNEFKSSMADRQAQLASLSEEARNNQELAREGYVSRAQASQANRMRMDAEIAFNTYKAAYLKEISGQLAEIQKVRDSLKGNLAVVEFNRDLSSIRAPVTGTIVGLKVNTKGGTVTPGQILGEVVPKEAKLVVDAQLPALGIERLHPGMPVNIRFTSLNMHLTPVIEGTVLSIDPDKQTDPAKGSGVDQDFYWAQIEAKKEDLDKLEGVKIQPGMPVSVVVVTGTRTAFSYLIKPLADRYAMAFKD